MPFPEYGVCQVTKDECESCVLEALEIGYRSIDTAQSYFNEEVSSVTTVNGANKVCSCSLAYEVGGIN